MTQLAALRFITCGSVDDGKSTLIGRLLLDSQAVLQDQFAGVQRMGKTDLALLTDGLSAEREQGITIDVAWRYFATPERKFIIGDSPGHEQYTRNMVTAASVADAAVVLVDATKLVWANKAERADIAPGELLAQTRRHSLLLQLLRVPSIVFAVNKLDAVAHPEAAFSAIEQAVQRWSSQAGIAPAAVVPISALEGWNVVGARAGWCGYQGDSLLTVLQRLPVTVADDQGDDTGNDTEHDPGELKPALAFAVQWVEKFSESADTHKGRRVFWGRVSAGAVQAGQVLSIQPGGHAAVVAEVLSHTRQRQEAPVQAGWSAGLVLDREVDVSRGDWLFDAATVPSASPSLIATVAWMDQEPLVGGRVYWALHGHRWVKARVARVLHQRNIQTLAEEPADALAANAIGRVELSFQEPMFTLPYAASRRLGAMILVDTASHATAGAVMVEQGRSG